MKTKKELEKMQASDLYLTETVSRLMYEISERDKALEKLNKGYRLCVDNNNDLESKLSSIEKRNAELEQELSLIIQLGQQSGTKII